MGDMDGRSRQGHALYTYEYLSDGSWAMASFILLEVMVDLGVVVTVFC